MGDATLGEHFVECPRSGIKAEVVFVPTIEIDLHPSKIFRPANSNGAVLLPSPSQLTGIGPMMRFVKMMRLVNQLRLAQAPRPTSASFP